MHLTEELARSPCSRDLTFQQNLRAQMRSDVTSHALLPGDCCAVHAMMVTACMLPHTPIDIRRGQNTVLCLSPSPPDA